MAKTIRCQICDEEVEKLAKALNRKLFDEKVKKFYCMQCLANYLDITVEELIEKAEEFKAEGCPLFQ